MLNPVELTGTDHRVAELVQRLKDKGHRITPQRMAILRALAGKNDHPSVEYVYGQVKTAFPMTSMATVYKTVLLLKEEGEILELGFTAGGNRYDLNKPYPHPHLICLRCQRILDPDIEMIQEIPVELTHKYGYKILDHRLDFFGICPDCQKLEVTG